MKYSVNFRDGKISVKCDDKEHIYPIGEIMCQTAKKESEAVECLIGKEERVILRREALQYLLVYYGEGKEEYADWKNEQARKWALMIAPELVEWYLNCIEKNDVHTTFETNMFSQIVLLDLLLSLHEKTRIVQCIKCKKFFVNNTNAEDCGCNMSEEEIEFRKEVDKMLSRRSEIDNKIIGEIEELVKRPLTAETTEKHQYYLNYRSRLLKILEKAINENLALDKIHKEFDKIEEDLGFKKGGKENDKIVQK